MTNLPKKLLTIKQGAQLLGVSTKTLRRWEKRKILLPALRTAGNQRRYTPEQLESFQKPKRPVPPRPHRAPVYRFFQRAFLYATLSLLLFLPIFAYIFSGSPALQQFYAKLAEEYRKETERFGLSIPQIFIGPGVPREPLPVSVLSAETLLEGLIFKVNVPASFVEKANFAQKAVFAQGLEADSITASNVIYSLIAGDGVSVTTGQRPTLANTGVLSLQSETGSLNLSAGTGISISGLEISNSDTGSSQNIFKKFAVSGQTDIEADSNTDTLTFANGTGIAITTDATNDRLTITASGSDLNVSGWTDDGTVVRLTTSTDKVGIGTANPTTTLYVSGTGTITGNTTLGGTLAVTGATTLSSTLGVTGNTTLSGTLNVSGATTLDGDVTLGDAATDQITFTGRMATGSSLLPINDLGADLGSSSLRFNNLWVANINANASQSFSGQTTFSYAPTDTTIAQASVLINPTTSAANGQLLGFAIAGYQRAVIDAEGDIILGYNDQTSAPSTSNPFMVYGHSSTNIAYIDTSGNTYLAGNLGIGTTSPDGLLHLSKSSGDPTVVFDIGDTNKFTLGVDDSMADIFKIETGGSLSSGTPPFAIDSSGNVGIGTASPDRLLHAESSTALTNTVTYAQRLAHITSGTPAANIGVGLEFEVETAADNNEVLGTIEVIASDVGAGTEDGDMIFKTMKAGAAADEKMRIDGDGNVGIGTTAPGYKLDVNGTINANSGLVIGGGSFASSSRFTLRGGSNQQLYAIGSNTGFQFWIDETPTKAARVRVGSASGDLTFGVFDGSTWNDAVTVLNSNGNVGIGTTAPRVALEVLKTAASPTWAQAIMGIDSSNYLSWGHGGTNAFVNMEGSGYLVFRHGFTNRMSLHSSGGFAIGSNYYATDPGQDNVIIEGNVGIGTTGPVNKLHVEGKITVADTVGWTGFETLNGTTRVGYFATVVQSGWSPSSLDPDPSENDHFIANLNGGDILFYTGNGSPSSERVRIDNTGNVGIGTTSPDGLLHLSKSSGDPNMVFDIADTNKFVLGVDDSDTDKFKIETGGSLGASATPPFTITSGGQVGIGTTGPVEKLDVNGAIKVGTTSSTCDASHRGVIKFVQGAAGVADHLWVCEKDSTDAYNWVAIGSEVGGFAHMKKITIDSTKVSADLTDFPVLINLASDTDLAADAQDDGDDIMFTSSDGQTKLDHEIEKFDGATGELVAWVKIPSLSSTTDTVIYMYYGNADAANQENATGVWSNGYAGVWHLEEEAAGTGNADIYKDSTANANHGNDYVSATGNTGQIGYGQEFDGADDYIDVGADASLQPGTGDYTIAGWAQTSDSGNYTDIFGNNWATDAAVELRKSNGDKAQVVFGDGSDIPDFATGTSNINDGQWHYIVGLRDADGNIVVYVDGSQEGSVASTTGNIDSGANSYQIGARESNLFWNGLLDEIRISSVVRSDGWIAASYNNQNSPSTFYSVGAEQSGDIAEWIKYNTSTPKPQPGDVVCVSQKEGRVEKCQLAYDPKIMGVVSTLPYLTMREDLAGEEAVRLALSGTVPVKVSTENGAIKNGDYLTSSSHPGIAMKATRAGRVIGIALEPYDGEGTGEVTVFINPHWWGGSFLAEGLSIDKTGSLAISGNVGIGTTGPSDTLHVAGQVLATTGVHIGVDQDANLIDDASSGSSSTTLYIGNESIDTTASDIRLKENIVLSEIDALALIGQMRVVDFDWKEANWRREAGRATGLIAQEVYEYLPQVVRKPDDDSYWSVEYHHLVPYLAKGIQELDERVRGLTVVPPSEEPSSVTSEEGLASDKETFTERLELLTERVDLLEALMTDTAVPPSEESVLATSEEGLSPAATPGESEGDALATLEEGLPDVFENVVIEKDLIVAGKTTLSDLGVTGEVTIGLLVIEGLAYEDTSEECIRTPSEVSCGSAGSVPNTPGVSEVEAAVPPSEEPSSVTSEEGLASGAAISTLSGPLKLQELALGDLEMMGGKVEIDAKGNLKINKGVIYANEQMRNAEKVAAGEVVKKVEKVWPEAPLTINVTPSWNTNVWVTEISEAGFTVNFGSAPSEEKEIYWLAMW